MLALSDQGFDMVSILIELLLIQTDDLPKVWRVQEAVYVLQWREAHACTVMHPLEWYLPLKL